MRTLILLSLLIPSIAFGSTALYDDTAQTVTNKTIDCNNNTCQNFPDTDTDEKVKVDSGATAGFLGAAFNDGVLRVDGSILTWSDGGDFVTIELDSTLKTNWDTAYTHSQGAGSDHADVAANTAASHAESHTISSHSDTTATGAELETLTDGSNSDSLHVHEGTAIKSTGEGGGTKYLREDGDGTSSWQTISAVGDMTKAVYDTNDDGTVDSSDAATALAANPTDCPGGQFANAIDTSGNLTCDVPAGGGDVLKTGTPVNNQLAIWTSATTIEGDADVTYDGTRLQVDTAELWVFKNGGNPRFILGDTSGVGAFGALQWNSASDYLGIGTNTGGYTTIVVKENKTVGINETSPGASFQITGSGAGVVDQIIKGGAAKSRDYFQILDSSSNEKFTVDKDGQIDVTVNSNLGSGDEALYINATPTGVGSAGIYVDVNAGVTANGTTSGLVFDNAVAATNASYFTAGGGYSYRPGGNRGLWGGARGVTTGTNIGGAMFSGGGDTNFGVWASATVSKASATNIGTFSSGLNTLGGGVQIGGYFTLYTANGVPSFESAALIADNAAQTSPIFLARDNGSTVFSVADGGAVVATGTLQANDYYSGDGTQGITDSSSYWLCTAANCSTSCQVTIKDGLIVGCP